MDTTLHICAELKAIFRRQAGGWLDRSTLVRAQALCAAAAQATAEPVCRLELGRVAHYAGQLHTHRAARIEALREGILLTLDAIEDRVHRLG